MRSPYCLYVWLCVSPNSFCVPQLVFMKLCVCIMPSEAISSFQNFMFYLGYLDVKGTVFNSSCNIR
jgi:hypothetical protein